MTQANMTELAETGSQLDEWRNRTLADLMTHIVAKHHAYLRTELPAIEALLSCPATGSNASAALTKVVRQFRIEMEQHLKKEEAILFPMIEKLEIAASSGVDRPRFPFGSIGNPIAVMEEEHERARKQLAEIRAITNDYTTVPEGCSKQPSTLARLRGLDNDMDIHSRLEDEILFPRAIRLEQV